VGQRDNSVFQLSLTEIAFTVAFILLILLGYLIFSEQQKTRTAQEELAKVQNAEAATEALEKARSELTKVLDGAKISNPDEVITKLVAAEEVHAERERLKQRIEDLNAQISALTEIKQLLKEVEEKQRTKVVADEVDAALALQASVRKAIEEGSQDDGNANGESGHKGRENEQTKSSTKNSDKPFIQDKDSKHHQPPRKPPKELNNNELFREVSTALSVSGELKKQIKSRFGEELKAGKELEALTNIVAAARKYSDLQKAGASPEVLKKENSDLRGQLVYLTNKLNARGGRDFPPCWANEDGKVEFLFRIDLKPESINVTAAWPPTRENDAQALPGMSEIISSGARPYRDFVAQVQGISKLSRQMECRHYVQLKSSIPDAAQSDRARLMVENYFYKMELPR
jgi:hypothetical protein